MKNVNELVLTVQSEGTESYAFVELFEIITTETINPKAESFKKQLKGQVEEAVSEGYALLLKLVNEWNRTGNFHSLFKTSYNNCLINLVKYMNRDKRKHDVNYDVSLSESAKSESGETSPLLEVASDFMLQNNVNFDNNIESKVALEDLLEKFAEEQPEKAGIITIMLGFTDDTPKSEKTKAYCVYYGKQQYTPQIQKRVSRAKEAFYNFLKHNDYPVNF